MIIEFATDLSSERVFAEGDEVALLFGRPQVGRGPGRHEEVPVATFENPRLVTDSVRMLELDPPVRESILALLASQRRTARFSGTRHEMNKAKYPLVWGPSIDTFFLCSVMHDLDITSVGDAAEIGCGSGFVGKYLLERLPPDAKLELVDIDAAALACAEDAVGRDRVAYIAQDAEKYLARRRPALVISNPPYLPSPDGSEILPFGGTRLLQFLVAEAGEYLAPGGRLIVLQSSVSASRVASSAPKKGLRSRLLRTLTVPMKVVSVLNDTHWMRFLEKTTGMRTESQGAYRLYHELMAIEITKL